MNDYAKIQHLNDKLMIAERELLKLCRTQPRWFSHREDCRIRSWERRLLKLSKDRSKFGGDPPPGTPMYRVETHLFP